MCEMKIKHRGEKCKAFSPKLFFWAVGDGHRSYNGQRAFLAVSNFQTIVTE